MICIVILIKQLIQQVKEKGRETIGGSHIPQLHELEGWTGFGIKVVVSAIIITPSSIWPANEEEDDEDGGGKSPMANATLHGLVRR